MKPIRHIALVTDGVAPYVMGGMAVHSFNLARYLARAGVQVDLYHYNDSAWDASKLEFFTAEERAYIRPVLLEFPRLRPLPGHYIRANRLYATAILKALRERPLPDFVYAQGFCGWEMMVQKKRGLRLPPVGVNFHGLEMFQRFPDFKTKLKNMLLLRGPVRENLRLADRVFTFPGKIRDLHLAQGVPADRLVELPIGVGEEWLACPEPAGVHAVRRIGFVGRYERRKGVEELTALLRSLPAGPEWEFHFIGPVPEAQQIRREGITYHGAVQDPAEVRARVRTWDVLVCPSWSEGMPNVILEAFAAGVAVLATDVGAVNYLVNDARGWLIPPADGAALARGFRDMLACPASELLARKHAAQAFARTELRWETIIARLLEQLSA